MIELQIAAHPLLDLGLLEVEYSRPLGSLAGAPVVGAAPLHSDDDVRRAVRDLLRHGGFKPTGRSKPSSEYLLQAASQTELPAINVAVDAANIVSLHSGLPISVVDLDRTVSPLRIDLAPAGARYVFNRSGQEIEVGGLLCLIDGDGPCANAVKDAQRTKTDAGTTRTLLLVWGTRALPGRTAATVAWYRELVQAVGAVVG